MEDEKDTEEKQNENVSPEDDKNVGENPNPEGEEEKAAEIPAENVPAQEPPPKQEPYTRRFRRPIAQPQAEPEKEEPIQEAELPSKLPDSGIFSFQQLIDREKYKDMKMKLKVMQEHQLFKDITNQFWVLLQISPENRVPRSELRKMLIRIYKLLLPRFNESSIDEQISYMLAYYIGGSESLDYKTFRFVLFEVAHTWSPNVDLVEYCSFLQAIWKRIVTTRVHRAGGEFIECPVEVVVSFPEEEERINVQLHGEGEWVECRPEEIELDGWEYMTKGLPEIEDYHLKYKRAKPLIRKVGHKAPTRAGFQVEEQWNVVIPQDIDPMDVEYRLSDLDSVLPFGYASEQFLVQLANVPDEKEGVNSLLTEELIVKNATKQGISNSKTMQGIQMIIDEKFKNNLTAKADIGNITKLVLNYLIKGGKDHLFFFKFPAHYKYAEIIQQFGRLPHGLDLRANTSVGLQRRLLLESLCINSVPEIINTNYSLERKDIKRAVENQISLKGNQSNIVMKKEDLAPHIANCSLNDPFLNDIDFTQYMQLVLSQKQIAIDRELTNLKAEPEAQSVETSEDPLKKWNTVKKIRQDAWTSEHSIIDFARQESLAILIIGKPRSGKTSVAKELAKSLDLIYIEQEYLIQKLIEKVANYQPPEDLEEGKEPPKYLTDIEERLMARLKLGKAATDFQIISLMNEALDREETQLKGYILELPLYKRNIPWAEFIRRERLRTHRKQFSYIVELEVTNEDSKLRASGIRCDFETNEVVSKFDRELRKKPKEKKAKNEDDDDEEEVQEESPEDEEKPRVFDENKIVRLANDSSPYFEELLDHYNLVERPALQKMIHNLPFASYIHLASAGGLTTQQLAEAILARIPERNPLRPLARSLEPEGDFKALLTQGLEENALPRQYSPWRMVDPVALFNGKLEYGVPDQPTVYANYVFVHANENNKKEFLKNPKKYLQQMPFMPKEYRVAILGQKGAGKREQAARLARRYGWKVYDVEKMIKSKVEALKQKYDQNEKIRANNPERKDELFFSAGEYSAIVQGKGVELRDGLVFMLEDLKMPLEKRRPPKVVPEGDEPPPEVDDSKKKTVTFEDEVEQNEEGEVEEKKEEKKEEVKKEEEEIEYYEDEEMEWAEEIVYPEGWKDPNEQLPTEQPAEEPTEGLKVEGTTEEVKEGVEVEAKEEAKEEVKEEEEPEYEDLPISEIALHLDEKEQAPFFGGYILVGLPSSEEDIQRMKEMGVAPEKFIFLSDMNEENPGEEIKKRISEKSPYWSIEADSENIKKAKTLCSDTFGEGNLIEVNCNGSLDTVFYNICNALDPFYPRIDDPSILARTTADLAEGQRPLYKGEYGDYCPITLKREKMLLVGDPETEVQYKRRTYRFASPTEMEEFKINPEIWVEEHFQRPPEPHMMLIGCRGAGVTTQLNLLSRSYQLPVVDIKDEFIRRLNEEKNKRKEMRTLLKGFKPKPPGKYLFNIFS